RLTVLCVVPHNAAAARKLPVSSYALMMSNSSLAVFNRGNPSGLLLIGWGRNPDLRPEGPLDQLSPCEVGTFAGHSRRLCHGQGHCGLQAGDLPLGAAMEPVHWGRDDSIRRPASTSPCGWPQWSPSTGDGTTSGELARLFG